MLSWRGWVLGLLVASLSACGSTVLLLPPPDADTDAAPDHVTADDRAIPADVATPTDDTVLDASARPDGADAADLGASLDAPTGTDALDPGDLPPDATAPSDTPDATAPSDTAAADTAITPDVPTACPNGLTDQCPTTFPGPCDSLSDGAPHTVMFRGLTTGLPASCEGAMTGAGPDGISPLTITTPSDVVIVARPTAGDTVVLTLSPSAGCGNRADELRCSNSSAGGSGGVATLRASTLGPGNYAVAVSTVSGRPVSVQATITPARPRARGDVCPGVVVTPDGAPLALSTTGFATEADVGTTCGSNGVAGAWVDAVFSYTLTAARDVTINVGASGPGDVALDVLARCGERASSVGACVIGNPARRIVRNQAPGTYYVVVEHRNAGASGRTLTATVTTTAPTLPGPADACPGVALAAGVVSTVDVAGLTAGSSVLTCFAAASADAVFGFVAPGTASDVLVNVAASDGARVGYALQSPCGGAVVGGCTGPAGSVWRRFQGLTAGQAYSVGAGTDGMAGTITAQYLPVPAATAASVTGNESCGGRSTLPVMGGVFRGNSSAAPQVLALPPCGGLGCAGGRAVYFQLTLAGRRRVLANTLESGFDTILSVNSGDTCPGRPVTNGCNDDTVAQASQVDVTLDAGTYFIIVQGCGFGRGGDYTLDVAVVAP